MANKVSPSETYLRRAERQDAQAVWEINNQLSVRQVSFSQTKIAFEDHLAWFDNVLSSSNRYLQVALHFQKVIGVVRFDEISQGMSEINIALLDEMKGKGLGSWLIANATTEYVRNRPSRTVVRAHIKRDNLNSVKAFIAAGYLLAGEVEVNHCQVLSYLWQIQET